MRTIQLRVNGITTITRGIHLLVTVVNWSLVTTYKARCPCYIAACVCLDDEAVRIAVGQRRGARLCVHQ